MFDFFRLDNEGSRSEFLKFAVQFDDPAFVRRARKVDDLWQELLRQCRSTRRRMLKTPRMRLALLGALVGHDWSALAPVLADQTDAERLERLSEEWKPALRAEVTATTSKRKTIRAVKQLIRSLDTFNDGWSEFVLGLNLAEVNRVREDYNNYYVLEKSCAFDSEQIGQAGFKRLLPVTPDHLLAEFPLLKVPRLPEQM